MYNFLVYDIIIKRIQSWYQKTYNDNKNSGNNTNNFLSNPFILKDMKNVEELNKDKSKILENYQRNIK